MATQYQVCDHPELLTKDGVCFLCREFEGQTDALAHLNQKENT